MSKKQPLPPRRSEGIAPTLIDAKGNQTTASKAVGLALPNVITTAVEPPRCESHAVYCPANEDRFNQLAKQMTDGGWELVAVVPHSRFVSLNGNSGVSNGWMSFWKRMVPPQAKEKANEPA